MILALARLMLTEATRAKVEEVVQKRLDKAAGERNQMVHGIWNKASWEKQDGTKM